jgi:hypothetical protein
VLESIVAARPAPTRSLRAASLSSSDLQASNAPATTPPGLTADRECSLTRRSTHFAHGRALVRVIVGGRDVGETLVREGLALLWREGAEARWSDSGLVPLCPSLSNFSDCRSRTGLAAPE